LEFYTVSGIAAVFGRSGTVSETTFDDVLGTLDYRGHDGRAAWIDDRVALGHQHHWLTPQAVGTEQPVHVDGVHLALDGRLDDRSGLADALGDTLPSSVESVSDARLLAHGYRALGTDVFERAVGAFAVVLYDEREEQFVCARDPTGIRHLFVAETPEAVVVGSDVATVRAHPSVAGEPNDDAVAAYLQYQPIQQTATFSTAVERLDHATYLRADEDGVRRQRYWHPAETTTRLDSPADARRRLRETLGTAIAARARSREQPALSLSGGLDSTAIAAVAAADEDIRPAGYSIVYESVGDDRMRAERQRMRDTATAHDLTHEEIVADDCLPLRDPTAYDSVLSESACLDPVQPSIDALNDAVEDGGHRIKLTGHGGNAFNGSRFAYADLLRRARLPTLFDVTRTDAMQTTRALLWFGLAPLAPGLAAHFTDTDDGPPAWTGDRLRATTVSNPTEPATFDSLHRENDYESFLGLTREFKLHQARRRALRSGIELRMPYLDRRVLELAYAIPPHWLLAGGEMKGLFRETFADVLPDSVLAIRKGSTFDSVVEPGLQAAADHVRTTLTDPEIEAAGYVADGQAVAELDRVLARGSDTKLLWRLYAVERYLRHVEGDR
jgi:asparagine synthase (glutamine-hydrolysing)